MVCRINLSLEFPPARPGCVVAMLLAVSGANVRRTCTQLVGLEPEVHLGDDSSIIRDHPQRDTERTTGCCRLTDHLLGWSVPEAAALRLDRHSGLLHS